MGSAAYGARLPEHVAPIDPGAGVGGLGGGCASRSVTEAQFVAAQLVRAARPTGDGEKRRYLLSGLVRCGKCGRRLDSHWIHGRAGYRCHHGRNSARPPALEKPKTVYVREDVLVRELAASCSCPTRKLQKAGTLQVRWRSCAAPGSRSRTIGRGGT